MFVRSVDVGDDDGVHSSSIRTADQPPRGALDGVTLRLHRIGTADVPTVPLMVPVLDDGERARAARTGDPAAASSFISGRYLMRRLIAEILDVDPGLPVSRFACPRCTPALGTTDHGRPGYTVDGELLPLLPSLSRAGGFVLLGILDRRGAPARMPPADTGRLSRPAADEVDAPGFGVDLESVHRTDFEGFDDVALTRDEGAAVGVLPEPLRAAARARFWARKEALAKALGTGFLDHEPNELEVLEDTRISDVPEIGLTLEDAGLVAAVAVV
jgi:4'-phosphopantetheinyl transferase